MPDSTNYINEYRFFKDKTNYVEYTKDQAEKYVQMKFTKEEAEQLRKHIEECIEEQKVNAGFWDQYYFESREYLKKYCEPYTWSVRNADPPVFKNEYMDYLVKFVVEDLNGKIAGE